MATRYFLMPSVSGDRVYTAGDVMRAFQGIVRDGYVQGWADELEVVPDSPASMDVFVSEGLAYIQGRYLEVFSEAESLTIPAADPSDPRIDRIVARLRLHEDDRDIELAVLQGTPASSPTAPSLTRTGETWEISLAQVLVAAAATDIDAGDITDERDDGDVCGRAISVSRPDPEWHVVSKSEDQDVSTTTLTNDDDLKIEGLVDGDTVTGFLSIRHVAGFSSASGLKWRVVGPSSTWFTYIAMHRPGTSPTLDSGAIESEIGEYTEGVQTASNLGFIIYFQARPRASGTINFQFAQGTSDPDPVTIEAGSSLTYTVQS